jgi:predicted porin
MKKALLSAAVLTALTSGAAAAATVYESEETTLKVGGRAEVRGLFLNDTVDGTMLDKSRARINFAGETKISENVTGFGFMEYEIKPGGTAGNRELFAGLETTAGAFSYGRQDTANVQIADFTDIASEHSGQQQYIGSASDKENNTFLYSNTFADMFTLNANYIAQENEDMDAIGISGVATLDFGLDLGASYSSQDDANQLTLGATYSMNDLYLGLTYAMGDVAEDDSFTSMEFAAQYKITKEFRVIGIVGMAQEDVAGDTEDFYAVEGQYRFTDNMRTYASYKLNNLDNGSDELLLGLRYDF